MQLPSRTTGFRKWATAILTPAQSVGHSWAPLPADSAEVEISEGQPLSSDDQWPNANGPLLATRESGWVAGLCFQSLQERKMKG